MNYYYDGYPRRRSIFFTLLLCVISAVIGGLLAVSLVPVVYGPGEGNIGTQSLHGGDNTPSLPPSSLDYAPVVTIAETVGPTVVGVSNQGMGRSLFRQQLVEQGSGSGVIISKEGHIVTNYHVIDGADKVVVTLADGRQLEAVIRGSDPETDLAVLQIEADNFPVSALGDSDEVRVGEMVVAIGNPLGAEFARSVTVGVISAKDREITIEDRKYNLIQTDAAINPGNSGGALVNSQGRVIGINSAKLVIQGVEGMGFAIPISDAKPIIDELIEKGYVSRPSLGIWGYVIDARLAAQNSVPQGIYISEPIAGGPASAAGLREGDIITGVNETKIENFDDLREVLAQFKPGDQINVRYYRRGKEASVALVLGERSNE